MEINYNILSYSIYIPLIFYITVIVGLKFYRNGEYYLCDMLNNPELEKLINKLLLVGYYLINLGHAALFIQDWNTIRSIHQLISDLAYNTGKIMIILALLHYFNLLWILMLSKSTIKLNNHGKL